EESRRIEPPPLKEQPKDFKAYYTPEFGDQLFVKYYRGGKWSESIAVTDNKQDLVRCAIAVNGSGLATVLYSARRSDQQHHHIYLRTQSDANDPLKWRAEQALTDDTNPHRKPGPHVNPAVCTDQTGEFYYAWQSREPSGIAFATSQARNQYV